jgi:TIR domain
MTFEYDMAISFAGEQRSEAEAIAAELRNIGITVFYDGYEKANLWGKDLYEHLSEVYQKKARYCLMLVSAAYAAKVWTTHERKSAQARALSQKNEYILPVRFDQTEVPGLLSTVGYLQFQEHGVAGICTYLAQKLRGFSESPQTPTASEQAIVPDPKEYWEQTRRLADTEILKKIWSKPRWRIWIRPNEFKKARFRDLEHCRHFMISSYVRVQEWFPYPWFSQDALETGNEWIAGEIEMSDAGRVSRVERWVLFRSGQFVHNRAFDEIPQLGNGVHVLEILDTVTAAFEFAARMAQQSVLSPSARITFELFGVDGRGLTWPQDVLGQRDAAGQGYWCQEESFGLTREATPAELEAGRRELAVDVAMEIYSQFGWSSPPKSRLAEEQSKRFDAV